MGFREGFDISFSGMKADLTQIEVASSNLANSLVTRTADGGPYRRRVSVLKENPISFQNVLDKAEMRISGGGVYVSEIQKDTSPYQRVYKPGHPDADAEGFVNFPNVRHSEEVVDLLTYSRHYEANLTAYNTIKRMAQDTLQIQ